MGGVTKEVQEYNRALFEQGLIKCHVCKEIKPLDDFCNNAQRWHGKSTRCKPCDYIVNQKVLARKRADLNVIKEAQGCKRCGYNEDGSKLHFHHRDPDTKLFNIAWAHGLRARRLQEELDKCDLLCATCHSSVEPRTPKGWKSKSTLDLELK